MKSKIQKYKSLDLIVKMICTNYLYIFSSYSYSKLLCFALPLRMLKYALKYL